MKELKVKPIKRGTVIDHIPTGMALKVLRILGISDGKVNSTVSIAMHVESNKMGWKDVVKVEDRELKVSEVNKISLIAPDATINIIREYEIVKKTKVKLPKVIESLMKCENPTCITNVIKEPVTTKFKVVSRNPPVIVCYYCEREQKNIEKNII